MRKRSAAPSAGDVHFMAASNDPMSAFTSYGARAR
jgi:hypothetical protein